MANKKYEFTGETKTLFNGTILHRIRALVKIEKYYVNVGDLVIFLDSGYQIGCTIIDIEDLFIRSLDNHLLNTKVKSYKYTTRNWTIKPVLEVNI